MPKTGIALNRILSVIAVVVLMLLACSQNGSDADQTDQKKPEIDMAEVRKALESSTPPERQEPFQLRPFDPSAGKDRSGEAVAYGCYRSGQAPGQRGPSNAEILEDLQIIARHWNLIRLYGADNDTRRILQLIDEHKLPIKVVQGIWLSPEEDDPDQRMENVNNTLLGMELANQYPGIVIAVSVGNETQVFWSGHRMNPDNLIRYIRVVRDNVAVPVTTADDYLYWNKPESKALAGELDFVFTHIHPLWNGKTLDEAIEWFDQIYHEVKQTHPDREIVIGETGWATDFDASKTGPGEQGTLIKGEVSLEAQATFLTDLSYWTESNQVTTFLFEAFDEPWKGGGDDSDPSHVEKHWGVYNEDRTPKESFSRYLENRGKDRD